ncbi:MAG: hypothetical protein WAV38_33805 [Xanthobacteraceae bacterium]|jgi:hypothetical protein
MCLACEQDAIWLAYLESQGLLQPDDPAAVEALFAGFPVQPLPLRSEAGFKIEDRASSAGSSPTEQNPFFCDDPKTG